MVLADALQKHLLIPDGFFDFVTFPGEGIHQVAVRALGDDVRHLLDPVAEVFKPQAVEQKVYVPGVVIPVIIDRVLFRGNNAFFLIIADQIRRNAKDSGHISDFVTQGHHHPVGSISQPGNRKKTTGRLLTRFLRILYLKIHESPIKIRKRIDFGIMPRFTIK